MDHDPFRNSVIQLFSNYKANGIKHGLKGLEEPDDLHVFMRGYTMYNTRRDIVLDLLETALKWDETMVSYID